MKVDLDALEQVARHAPPGVYASDRDFILAQSRYSDATMPDVTLALIARIRELDEALNDALAYTIPGDERDRLVRVLAKGVTT